MVVRDDDRSEVYLRPGSLTGSIFRTLRQGQRIIFEVTEEDGNSYVSGTTLVDTGGHGTMVAGIISGNGATGSGAADCQGFYYGTGIAPLTRLVPIKIFHYNTSNCLTSSATDLMRAASSSVQPT